MGQFGFSHARLQTLPIEDAKRLSRELSELLAGADIIGLRAFGPNPSDVQIRKGRTRNALFGEVEKSACSVSADTGASE
jgi:hypothetical protein